MAFFFRLQVPPRIPIGQQHEIMAEAGLSGPLCYDKRIYVTNLSKTERAKHTHFTQKTIVNREDVSKLLSDFRYKFSDLTKYFQLNPLFRFRHTAVSGRDIKKSNA